MTFEDPTDEGANETPEIQESAKGLRQQLEAAKAAEKAAAERAAEAEKFLAFARAGVDAKDPKFDYFVAGYKGEISPDAIRQEADRLGFFTPGQTPETQVPPAELAAHTQAAQFAAGANAPAAQPPSWQSAEYDAEMANARTPAEVHAIMAKYGSPTSPLQ